jgi:hypothetical protein
MRKDADFGRLAAAMLYEPRTSVMSTGRKSDEEVETVTAVMPTAQSHRRRVRWAPPVAAPSRPQPSPGPQQQGAVLIPAYMVLRGGAGAPAGLGPSLPFLVLIALAVVLLGVLGLELGGQLLQG